MRVGIIGYGWVGRAQHSLFTTASIYDNNSILSPTYSMAEINKCDVAFVCVPTPCEAEGRLSIVHVREVVEWCKCPLIVIRSTVNPGDCDFLVSATGKRIVYQPEYLGESPAHPFLNMAERKFLIIGGEPQNRRMLIELYQTVYNANVTIRQMSLREAEVVKLSENRAIAWKVAQCQELYDACQAYGIDYYSVRDAVYGDDPRFTLWFTFVYPDKRGMNSKCIPKDVYAWCAWAESCGVSAELTRAILERNKEWIRQSSTLPTIALTRA